MVLDRLAAWSPWSPTDAVRWLTLSLLGHLVCAAAWWLSTTEDALGDQVRWTALGMSGFLLVSYVDVTWLLRARFAVLQRREALLPTATLADPPAATHVDLVVAGPDLGRFHRPDCPLAAAKGWPLVARAVAATAHRPCGVCEP